MYEVVLILRSKVRTYCTVVISLPAIQDTGTNIVTYERSGVEEWEYVLIPGTGAVWYTHTRV
jgi:hypothetical protein